MKPAELAQWMLTASRGERLVYALREFRKAETPELGELKRAALKGWQHGRVRLLSRRVRAPDHNGLGAFELIAEKL